jgi:hypothetical protein
MAAVALICGLAAYVGMPVLRLFEHDVVFLLENGYRASQGQLPHRDFSSAYGPVFFLIEATGLALSRMRPAGVAYANALFGALIALWTYRTARGRLAGVGPLVLSVYAALLITAPYSLGYNPVAFSYGMLYNRYGYGLLGIIVLECGLQALRAPEREAAGRGFWAGVAWALLAFLKISYALTALPFLLLWICCGASRGRRWLACCGGFGVVAAIMFCYLRFDLGDMFRDLANAARGRSASWRPEAMLSPVVVIESLPLLLLAAVWTAGIGQAAARGVLWKRVRVWLFVLSTVGVGGFLLSTNHQAMSLPLDGIAAVLLVDAVVRRETGGGDDRMRWLLAMFLGALCVLPLTLMNGVSLAAAARERWQGPAAPAVLLQSARGASILLGPVMGRLTTETGGAAYAETLNDGMDLIRTHAGPSEGALAIDLCNPFNYLLGRPSPRGGMASAGYHVTFSETAHPSADRYFGEARWVLVRKYSKSAEDFPIEDYLIQGILRVYGPALEQRFRPVAETGHWVLWRRQ